MSTAIWQCIDNIADQDSPTKYDIYIRPRHRLEGDDLALTQNAVTVSYYERCSSKSAEIELKFACLDDSVLGLSRMSVMVDAATDIVDSISCNIFSRSNKNGQRSWRQITREHAIEKTTTKLMWPEYSRRSKARVMEELTKRASMRDEYRDMDSIHG